MKDIEKEYGLERATELMATIVKFMIDHIDREPSIADLKALRERDALAFEIYAEQMAEIANEIISKL